MDFLSIINLPEIKTILFVFFLFVVPRILLRFGLPMPLSAFFLGFIGQYWTAAIIDDQIVYFLSLLGISSLFLLAGLEVDLEEVESKRKVLLEYIFIMLMFLIVFALGFMHLNGFGWTTAVIIALTLLTPSTGFILDALPSFGINSQRSDWVKTLAIGAEILALGLLVVTSQIDRPVLLIFTLALIVSSLYFLPWLFKKVSKPLAKIAPGSDFSLLILLAIILSMITKKLGAYYLVGAFCVGIAARRYVHSNRDTSTDELLKAIALFSSFFMPFYFLRAGAGVSVEYLTLKAFGVGILLLIVALPTRVLVVFVHRKLRMEENNIERLQVATALLPTLVFGIVLSNILKDSGKISNEFYGALIIVTVLLTLIPSLTFKYYPRFSKIP